MADKETENPKPATDIHSDVKPHVFTKVGEMTKGTYLRRFNDMFLFQTPDGVIAIPKDSLSDELVTAIENKVTEGRIVSMEYLGTDASGKNLFVAEME